MKKLMILAAILSLLFTSCATIKYVTPAFKQPVYSAVVESDLSASELFSNSSEWMVESFVSSEAVLEVNEPSIGLLKGKFKLSEVPSPTQTQYGGCWICALPSIKATITIRVKENKAMIEIIPSTEKLKTYYSTSHNTTQFYQQMDKVEFQILDLIDNWKESVVQKTDW